MSRLRRAAETRPMGHKLWANAVTIRACRPFLNGFLCRIRVRGCGTGVGGGCQRGTGGPPDYRSITWWVWRSTFRRVEGRCRVNLRCQAWSEDALKSRRRPPMLAFRAPGMALRTPTSASRRCESTHVPAASSTRRRFPDPIVVAGSGGRPHRSRSSGISGSISI